MNWCIPSVTVIRKYYISCTVYSPLLSGLVIIFVGPEQDQANCTECFIVTYALLIVISWGTRYYPLIHTLLFSNMFWKTLAFFSTHESMTLFSPTNFSMLGLCCLYDQHYYSSYFDSTKESIFTFTGGNVTSCMSKLKMVQSLSLCKLYHSEAAAVS